VNGSPEAGNGPSAPVLATPGPLVESEAVARNSGAGCFEGDVARQMECPGGHLTPPRDRERRQTTQRWRLCALACALAMRIQLIRASRSQRAYGSSFGRQTRLSARGAMDQQAPDGRGEHPSGAGVVVRSRRC
jgi:hypothetical protein